MINTATQRYTFIQIHMYEHTNTHKHADTNTKILTQAHIKTQTHIHSVWYTVGEFSIFERDTMYNFNMT